METTDRILYARQCDITGEGMNEGYCIQDGHIYIKYVEDMIKHLREVDTFLNDKESHISNMTDEELLNEYYNSDYYYLTEWECESDLQYEEINGKLIEINN